MSKRNIFKLVSLIGMAIGGIGTLVSAWADDKELDAMIDEKLDKRLADHESEEESEEP